MTNAGRRGRDLIAPAAAPQLKPVALGSMRGLESRSLRGILLPSLVLAAACSPAIKPFRPALEPGAECYQGIGAASYSRWLVLASDHGESPPVRAGRAFLYGLDRWGAWQFAGDTLSVFVRDALSGTQLALFRQGESLVGRGTGSHYDPTDTLRVLQPTHTDYWPVQYVRTPCDRLPAVLPRE